MVRRMDPENSACSWHVRNRCQNESFHMQSTACAYDG
jgi:hypothetical protein